MRTINNIVLHCTATPQTSTIASIKKYWKEVRKWKAPGYHFIIKPDGGVVELLPIEQVSNGVAGHNKDSINISYIGGVDPQGNAIDNRTDSQVQAQIELIKKFKGMFPHAKVLGHRDFPGVSKECPSFDVQSWLKTVGL